MFDVARGARSIPNWFDTIPGEDPVSTLKRSLWEYLRECRDIILYRRFFTSGPIVMGLAPPHVEVGDYMVILLGCNHPVILRKRNETWELIGDSYVHAFIDGEVFEWAAAGKTKLQTFSI